MTGKGKPKRPIPKPCTLTLPKKHFQPGKAEMETACHMPEASVETICATVLQPFSIRHEEPD